MNKEQPQRSLPRQTALLMGLLTAYLAFYCAAPSEPTAILALALPVLFAALCLRSAALAVSFGAVAAIGLFSTGSFLSAAAVVATVSVVGLGAAAMLHLKPWLSVLLGISAYTASLAFTKDALASLYVFQLIPCAVLLAVLIAKGVDRVPTICAVSVGLLLTLATPIVIGVYKEYGELSAAVLTKIIDTIRAQAVEAFHASLPLLPEDVRAVMTEDAFHDAFDAIVALFPAIVVTVCNLGAFFADLITITVFRKTGYAKKLSLSIQVFVMSKVSAIVFIIALLLPILGLGSSADAQVITVTAENINLMLMPAFLFTGFLGVVGFFLRQRGCLNLWVILAIAALLIYAGNFILYPLAIFGAIRTLRTPRHFRS